MKKVIAVYLLLSILCGVSYAEIRKTTAERNVYETITQIRSYALSARIGFTQTKARLDDLSTVYSGQLESADSTILASYQTKLQAAIDGMNTIINKIDTDFPTV